MVKGYVPAIDGMRAVAILLVISSHLGAERFVPGGFGVTLFFFISGFLITGLMIAEHDANGSISIPMFYARRFLRLAPALLVMVAVVSMIFAFIKPIPPAQIAVAVFYFMNYYTIFFSAATSPLDPMWSLAVEEHYYLLFPLIFAATWVYRDRFLIGLIVVSAAVLLWRCALVIECNAPETRTYLATDTRIDSILYGAILAVWLKCFPASVVRLSKFLWPLGAAAILISFVYRNDIFRETFRYSLQGLALIPLFYTLLYNAALSPLKRILEWAPLVWIGKISYSLYLWHFAVLLFANAEMPGGGMPWLAFNLLADVLLACGSYYLIEKYFQKLRQRFRSHAATMVQPVLLSTN